MISIYIGAALGIIGFEIAAWLKLQHARSTRSQWEPTVQVKTFGKVSYANVEHLTSAQAKCYVEDIRKELICQSKHLG